DRLERHHGLAGTGAHARERAGLGAHDDGAGPRRPDAERHLAYDAPQSRGSLQRDRQSGVEDRPRGRSLAVAQREEHLAERGDPLRPHRTGALDQALTLRVLLVVLLLALVAGTPGLGL